MSLRSIVIVLRGEIELEPRPDDVANRTSSSLKPTSLLRKRSTASGPPTRLPIIVAIQLLEKSLRPLSTRNSGSDVCTASGVSFAVFTDGSVKVWPVILIEGGADNGGAGVCCSPWARLTASLILSSAARIARTRQYDSLV